MTLAAFSRCLLSLLLPLFSGRILNYRQQALPILKLLKILSDMKKVTLRIEDLLQLQSAKTSCGTEAQRTDRWSCLLCPWRWVPETGVTAQLLLFVIYSVIVERSEHILYD